MKKLFLLAVTIASAFLSPLCQAQTVTWATFNIRYDNPADQSNNWQFRKDTVTRFIKTQDMDIVGMQEVLHNQLEDLLQRLPGYKSIGVGRPYFTRKAASKYWRATRSGSRNTPIA